MRLKKITIFGFKSFADKTTFHFDAGLTCIVGPNGCGKSNIADAFRWVLGEQSAKSLRGAKMPDVIFAGTNHRKPLNYAEVSLTLTDIQGSLPVDYEEVTLTRRLHRSGESEYFINGNSVRLKDLQSLFLDSGIGRNAFSIFEQGKLDQVINYSPMERRYIFEEAAGILRFLQRKKEALKRLEQSEINLSRVADIHREVEKQIGTLEEQAQKARIYKENKNRLEIFEKTGFVLRWQGVEKKCSDLQKKKLSQEGRLEEAFAANETFESRVIEAKQLVQQHNEVLKAKTAEHLTMRGQFEMQTQECRSLQQRLRESEQREKRMKQEIEDLSVAKQARQAMLAEIEKKREALEGDWNQAESEWMSHQDKVRFKEKEVEVLRSDLAAKHHAHLKSMQIFNQLQSDLKQAEIRCENQEERSIQVSQRHQQLIQDQSLLSEKLKDRKQDLQEISNIVDQHKNHLKDIEEEIQQLNTDGEETQRALEKERGKAIEAKARQKVLIRLREEFEGFSPSSKLLLEEANTPQSILYSKLKPLYEYFPDSECNPEALAVILRAYTHTLVVEKEADLYLVLDFAEKKQLQDYSLVCLEWLSKDLISIDSLLSNALQGSVAASPLLKHFFHDVAMVESQEELFNAWTAKNCAEGWSSQGAYIDHRGVLFILKPNENHLFMREAELKQLEEELLIKEKSLLVLEEKIQQITSKRSNCQKERTELDKILRKDEMKLVEVNYSLQRTVSDLEKNQFEQTKCENESGKLQAEIVQQKEALVLLDQRKEEARLSFVRLQEELDVFQQELQRQEGALRIQQHEQKEKGAHYQQLANDRQQLLHRLNLLEEKEKDHDKHLKRILSEIADINDNQTALQKEEAAGQSRLKTLEEQLVSQSTDLGEFEKEGRVLSHLLQQSERQYAVCHEECKKIENEGFQLSMQLSNQEEALRIVADGLSERFNLTIQAALDLPLPIDRPLEDIEKQIRTLRQLLQDAGDVNMTAIEELEKHQVRSQFLKSQIEDLQSAKIELMDIIQQLDGESRKLFTETFEAVRQNFKKNFQILFNGGEADLQLTEKTDDILSAGIEISAKPPGKHMRSISLLSGGEKCLTAVALLFAIFEVKPAPFCILDEIDAPLDDTNIERFVNVVKHYTDRCQFIIITHNKRTMAIGDVLFGVTMEEKGVSKLLSLSFSHRGTPEASLI